MSESGNWIYPSERMFFEAMKRKGYQTEAENMKTIGKQPLIPLKYLQQLTPSSPNPQRGQRKSLEGNKGVGAAVGS